MIYRRYTVALSAGKARKHCVSLGINYVTDRVYCTVIRGEIERNLSLLPTLPPVALMGTMLRRKRCAHAYTAG